jgi:fumarate reductase subunit C
VRRATQVRLWYAQRISGAVLAIFVLVHLATIVYAVRGGLTAADILGRTRGSAGIAAFYGVFVIACAIHAPIGLARVAEEWLGWNGRSSNTAAALFAVLVLAAGLRAVYAVVAP